MTAAENPKCECEIIYSPEACECKKLSDCSSSCYKIIKCHLCLSAPKLVEALDAEMAIRDHLGKCRTCLNGWGCFDGPELAFMAFSKSKAALKLARGKGEISK